MLLGAYIGSIGAYAFLCCWMLLFAAQLRPAIRALTATWQFWLLPGLTLCSVLWSQAPAVTMRHSLEFAATAGCAALAARMLSPRQVISALLISLFLVAMVSLVAGHTAVDVFTGSVDFVGVFESKNEMAFFVSLMLLAACAVLFDRGQPALARCAGLISLLPVMPLLIRTHSATSQVTSVLAVAVMLGNLLLARHTPKERARILLSIAAMVLPMLALLSFADELARGFIVHVLGKDTTLTGRTLLWDHALDLIPQHPLLGWGWQAFWQRDTINAESLWREFHVASRQGFHFHNTYLQTVIELGYVGGAVLVGTLLVTLVRIGRWSWRDRTMASSFYLALLVCLIARSFVEVDIMFEFQIGAFMFFVIICYACDRGGAPPRPRLADWRQGSAA